MAQNKQVRRFYPYKIARIAALASRGAGVDEIVSFLQKRYYPKLSGEEVYKIYFGMPRGGGRVNIQKLFIGKTPDEIKRNLEDWYQKRKAFDEKISAAHSGKITPLETREKISAALQGRPRYDLRGRIFTDAHRANISAAKKGVPNIKLRGRSLLEETKAKISAAHEGKTIPEETRAKISATLAGRPRYDLRGRVVSDETRAKISAALRAKPSFLGKKHTDEAKAKMSAAATGRTHTDKAKAKISASRKGKPLSEEHKRKLSEVLMGREVPWSVGKTFTPEHRAKISAGLRRYWGKIRGTIALELEEAGLAPGREYRGAEMAERIVADKGLERELLERNRNRIVAETLASLPPLQRAIVYFKFGFGGEEFRISKIAAVLGVNLKDAKTEYKKALRTLSKNRALMELIAPER
ncbi:MAG: NUMOD3 domain-containing DNA-binding protein [Candidatus Diapherotrites archaeon]